VRDDPTSLALLRRWARLFDAQFRVPGTRFTFGLDPIIGLIPGLGDLASPLLTLAILWQAAALKVPKVVVARMVLNALIDAALGVVPVIGDAFDFAWKSNVWNLALLERHALPGVRPTRGDWAFVLVCIAIVIACAIVPLLVTIWLLRHVPAF
jgi:hypothetical protein